MKLKTIIALLLVLCMAFALTACAEEEEDSIRRRKSERTSSAKHTEPTETEEVTEEETEAETEPEEMDVVGTVDGPIYTNFYFGFAFALEKGWTIANEKERSEILGITAEYIGMEELLEQGIYCDFYAMTSSGDVINVMIQKQNYFSKRTSDEEIADSTAVALAQQFEALGYNVKTSEAVTLNVAGQDHSAVYFEATINGTTLYEYNILWRTDDYMASATIGTKDPQMLEEVLEYFYEVDDDIIY